MDKKYLTLNNRKFPLYRCHTLVIGSGAAALNCADHLKNFGVEDVVIVTAELGGGTSNNSGSDKQTYYKLSLFGNSSDSVYEMAATLFSGGAMHGDIALIEAALSVQEFFHLVQIGVPFPHNLYGGYVGYKTDHDPKQRATSAGPWTSNQMYEKLLLEVQKKQIPILDQLEIVTLLTMDKRVIGALAIDHQKVNLGIDSFVVFQAENIVLGTGGPGGIYESTVYPLGHLGSTGIALEIGAQAMNLTEWQYGLASTKFRWNVSGTYQQVIPRYYSVDETGNDQQEFLNLYFPSISKLASSIFLKGYQWPFDVQKIKNFGSSLIDILVYQETVLKGRRVFLDFQNNPSDEIKFGKFNLQDLEPEAANYLKKSGANSEKPISRLEQMNPMAIELYRQHGIDLFKEPLEVAVCAQHNNGGLKGSIWWESNIKHLFLVGEVNGSHGVYRPGGSALNSGQVGGYRTAQFISEKYNKHTFDDNVFLETSKQRLADEIFLIKKGLFNAQKPRLNMLTLRKEMQKRMSKVGAHIRNSSEIREALQKAKIRYEMLKSGNVFLEDRSEIVLYFQNRQLALTEIAVLESINFYINSGGGSRGSSLILADRGEKIADMLPWGFRPEDEKLRNFALEYQYLDGAHETKWRPVREIPEDDNWFENIWKAYVAKEIFIE